MNTSTSTKKIIGAAVVLLAIIIAVIVVIAVNQGSSSPTTVNVNPLTSTSTASTASSTAPAKDPLTFMVITAKKSYSQNEKIAVVVEITNNTAATTTLSFKDGCQALYTIAGFDLGTHIRCLPEASTIVIGPHQTEQTGIVHYPSVYMIPVGSYTMAVRIVGYGQIDVPVTITP